MMPFRRLLLRTEFTQLGAFFQKGAAGLLQEDSLLEPETITGSSSLQSLEPVPYLPIVVEPTQDSTSAGAQGRWQRPSATSNTPTPFQSMGLAAPPVADGRAPARSVAPVESGLSAQAVHTKTSVLHRLGLRMGLLV